MVGKLRVHIQNMITMLLELYGIMDDSRHVELSCGLLSYTMVRHGQPWLERSNMTML